MYIAGENWWNWFSHWQFSKRTHVCTWQLQPADLSTPVDLPSTCRTPRLHRRSVVLLPVNTLAKHFVIHLGPGSQTQQPRRCLLVAAVASAAAATEARVTRPDPAPAAIFPAGSDVAINRSIHFPVSILANCSSWIFLPFFPSLQHVYLPFFAFFLLALLQIVCSAFGKARGRCSGFSLTTVYKIFSDRLPESAAAAAASWMLLALSWQLKVFNEFFSKLIEVNASWKMH